MKGHQLIDPKRLAELEQQAEDGVRLRAALKSLDPKRYEMMEITRVATLDSLGTRARGWLECYDQLGEALAAQPENVAAIDDEAVPF